MASKTEPLLATDTVDPKHDNSHGGLTKTKVAVIAILVVILGGLGLWQKDMVVAVVASLWGQLKGLGYPGACPIVFILCWVLCSVSGPAFLVEVGGGALFEQIGGMDFGVYIGMLTCGSGMWLGCVTAFYLGRKFFKPLIEESMKKHEVLVTINEMISEDGWKFAFLMRLNPLIPIELFNYAVAMTDISPVENAIAALGSMPIVCFEVYTAASAAAIASAAAADHSGKSDDGTDKIKDMLIKLAVSVVLMGIVMLYGKSKYDAKVKEKEQKANIPTPPSTVSPYASLARTISMNLNTWTALSAGMARVPSMVPQRVLATHPLIKRAGTSCENEPGTSMADARSDAHK